MGSKEGDIGRRWRVTNICILLMLGFSSCSSIASANAATPTAEPTPERNPIKVVPKDMATLLEIDTTKNTRGFARVVGTTYMDDLDQNELTLPECPNGWKIVVWISGYYLASIPCDGSPARVYEVYLEKIETNASPPYSWLSAFTCGGCHNQGDSQFNEFSEWGKSNHAKTLTNRYFETMYWGTSLAGGTGPLTNRDVISDDLLSRAPTAPASPNPGYKLDYPNSNGNCAFCHAPVAVARDQIEANPFSIQGVGVEGVTCDICHKVINVEMNDNGVPYETRPGVLSFEFLLPPGSENFYVGPLTNINPDNTSMKFTCSTIFSRSEFCAACHYGKFYDTVIYGSYLEWKESSYAADPNSDTYRTCQDCHMPSAGKNVNNSASAQRRACTDENVEFNNFDHNLMQLTENVENFGGFDTLPLLIKNAAVIKPWFQYKPEEKNWFTVQVTVMSQGVGHRFPTDSPLRHLILVVEAKDQRGTPLIQVNGERIPNWAGVGTPPPNPKIKNYGGLPGKIFANLLVEEDTNISPTAAYWNKTKYAWVGALGQDPYDYSDTRLLPGRANISYYSFSIPEKGNVTVTIQLIYRFAFMDLMWQKGWWDRPDILVAEVVCTGPPTEPLQWTCDPPLTLP